MDNIAPPRKIDNFNDLTKSPNILHNEDNDEVDEDCDEVDKDNDEV